MTTYWKSEYTGQVYKCEDGFTPNFGGWIQVTEQDYIKYKENGGF